MLRSVVRRHRQLTRILRDPCVLASCGHFSQSSRTYSTPVFSRSIFNEGSTSPSGVSSFGGWNIGFSSALNDQQEGEDAEAVAEEHKPSVSISRALRSGPLSKVMKVFEEMKAKEAQGVRSYVAVMRACSREGNLPMLIKVMKEMEDAGVPADKYVYNTYIHAFAKTGDLDGALEIFDQMQKRGIPHDAITYRSLMMVAAAGKQLDKVKDFFEKAMQYEPNDVRNYNFMMTAYDKVSDGSGAKEDAEKCMELFEQLKEKNIKPDTHTYQHLMKACAKARMLKDAMKYMDEAVASGAGVRLVMYDIQIETLADANLEDDELESKIVDLFKHMDKQRLRPTIVTFERVIDIISKQSNVERAMAFMDRLKKEGIKPAGALYTGKLMCIKRMAEQGTSAEDCLTKTKTLLNEMAGMRPSIPGYSILFEIFARANALDIALEHWQEFQPKIDSRRKADESIIESMMQLYLKNDKTDKAVEMFDEMEKHGAIPRLETFHVVLGHMAENGGSQHAARVQKKIAEAKVEPDEKLQEALKKLQLV